MVRILLIEDDSTIAAGLAYSLEQEGWSVTCKGTLAQGRNALETGEYQLLLVDVGLPDGSGYDLCAAAKSRNIPVILSSIANCVPFHSAGYIASELSFHRAFFIQFILTKLLK